MIRPGAAAGSAGDDHDAARPAATGAGDRCRRLDRGLDAIDAAEVTLSREAFGYTGSLFVLASATT
jgi:hypothetical protein